MKVKRYGTGLNGRIEEMECGAFTGFAEYSALLKERDALAAENASLKKCCDAYDADGLAQYGDQWEVTPLETPVTDAAIANIQAQGVEKFAQHPALGIIACGHIALEFAAQLRKEASNG